MATSFAFYEDSSLATLLNTLSFTHNVSGTTDPQTRTVYFGSTTANVKVQTETNPGTGLIQIQIVNITQDWEASTAYAVNDVRKSASDNGYRFTVTSAGTSGTSEPTWDTSSAGTTTDGTVTWGNADIVHETAEVKLALSSAGLTSATGGQALSLGVEVLSGVSNAIPIFLEIDDATAVIGTQTELQIRTVDIIEVAA